MLHRRFRVPFASVRGGETLAALTSVAVTTLPRFHYSAAAIDAAHAALEKGTQLFDSAPWDAVALLTKPLVRVPMTVKKKSLQVSTELVREWSAYAVAHTNDAVRYDAKWQHVAAALGVLHRQHLPLKDVYDNFVAFFDALLRDPIGKPRSEKSLLTSLAVFRHLLQWSDLLPSDINRFAELIANDVSAALAKGLFKPAPFKPSDTPKVTALTELIHLIALISPMRKEWASSMTKNIATAIERSSKQHRCSVALTLARNGLYDELHAGNVVRGLTPRDFLMLLPAIPRGRCPAMLEADVAKALTTFTAVELEGIVQSSGATDTLLFDAARRWLQLLPAKGNVLVRLLQFSDSVLKALAKEKCLDEGGLPVFARTIAWWTKNDLVVAALEHAKSPSTAAVQTVQLARAAIQCGVTQTDVADSLQRLLASSLVNLNRVDDIHTVVRALTTITLPKKLHPVDIARSHRVATVGVDVALTKLAELIDGDTAAPAASRAFATVADCAAAQLDSHTMGKISGVTKVLHQYVKAKGADSLTLKTSIHIADAARCLPSDADLQALKALVMQRADTEIGLDPSSSWSAVKKDSGAAVKSNTEVTKKKAKKGSETPIAVLKRRPSGHSPDGETELAAQEALEHLHNNSAAVPADDVVNLLKELVRVGYRRAAVVGPVFRTLIDEPVRSKVTHAHCADILDIIAGVDRSEVTKEVFALVVQAARNGAPKFTRETAVPIALAAGRVAASYPDTVPECRVVIAPSVAWLMRNFASLDGQTALLLLTALAQCNVQHPTASQTLLGHINETRSTLSLSDIDRIMTLVDASPDQQLRNAVTNVGRAVVSTVVGGALSRGAVDHSPAQLETLANVLTVLFVADRTAPDIFRACVQRRRELSPDGLVAAFRLAGRMPTLPPEWSTLADYVLKNVFTDPSVMAKYGAQQVLRIANDIVRSQPPDADRSWLAPVEQFLAERVTDIEPQNLAKLFLMAYRAHRSDSVALESALQRIDVFVEGLRARDIHTIISTMFSMHVKNGRALKQLFARASAQAKDFPLLQLRTVLTVGTKTRMLDPDDARRFADVLADRLNLNDTPLDPLAAVSLMLFLARFELVGAHLKVWRQLVRVLARHRGDVSNRVSAASQAWEALSIVSKLPPLPPLEDGKPQYYVDPDLHHYFEKRSATLPKATAAPKEEEVLATLPAADAAPAAAEESSTPVLSAEEASWAGGWGASSGGEASALRGWATAASVSPSAVNSKELARRGWA